MIPKIIHYCWFGKGKLSNLERKCLASWKRYCPEYEVKLWNESNFNVDFCRFTKEAYIMGKYAFVSDVARIYALSKYGGIYFDTDLLLIRPLQQSLLNTSVFMARESFSSINAAVLGGEKDNQFFENCLEYYKKLDSFDEQYLISRIIDTVLKSEGLYRNEIEIVDRQVFYPLPYKLRKFHYARFLTDKTIGVHLWEGTWKKHNWSIWERLRYQISRAYVPRKILTYEP